MGSLGIGSIQKGTSVNLIGDSTTGAHCAGDSTVSIRDHHVVPPYQETSLVTRSQLVWAIIQDQHAEVKVSLFHARNRISTVIVRVPSERSLADRHVGQIPLLVGAL